MIKHIWNILESYFISWIIIETYENILKGGGGGYGAPSTGYNAGSGGGGYNAPSLPAPGM